MARLVLWHRLFAAPRDSKEGNALLLQWIDRVADRMTAAGGEFVMGSGGSIVLLFDGRAIEAALDTALELLDEAGRSEPEVRCCFAVALGSVIEKPTRVGPQLIGSALDRAQLLANRGRAGELVLAREVETAAETTYLFDRQVPTGTESPRGRTIDRKHPRRSACRPAMQQLLPPEIPPGLRSPLARLEELARAPVGVDRVLLRGPLGKGSIEWLEALAREHQAGFVLHLLPAPAALEPLGTLRTALTALAPEPKRAIDKLDAVSRRTLSHIALGEPVHRSQAVLAFRNFLKSADSGRPWLLADVATSLDPSTLSVLGEVLTDEGPSCLFVARLPSDAQPPTALQEAGILEELAVPTMHRRDAYHVAQSVLGDGTPQEVIRRIAILGAGSPLAVLEAARTLVGAADLIHDGSGFRWRASPRSGVAAVPVESLIDERLASLEPVATRVLELVCVAPRRTPKRVLQEACKVDGIGPEGLDEALRILAADAFVKAREPVETTSDLVRAVVHQRIDSARLVTLHSSIGRALEKHFKPGALFARATVGFYLGEGGLGKQGAQALLRAGQEASQHEFARAALRLAAAAVQYNDSQEVSRDASKLSRLISSQRSGPTRSSVPSASSAAPASLSSATVAAFHDRDYDRVDQLVDMAIAEGRDQAAAERLRALAQLARGDVTAAIRSLGRAQQHEADRAPSQARGALTRALVLLSAGEHRAAIRAALMTLAHARETASKSGEVASLQVLGDCFEALGRSEDARAIRAGLARPENALSFSAQ